MGAIPVATLLGFFLTALAVELTPGPNMAYLGVLSVERGRTPGLYAVAGVALGLAIIGALAAVGLAAIISQHPLAYQVVRWAGVLYLVWLGYDTWHQSRLPLGVASLDRPNIVYFRRGLITNLLNPKAAVFYVAVLPNFLGAEASGWAFGTLVVIYVFAATLVHTLIVLAGAVLTPFFVTDARRKSLGVVFGLALVVIAVWLAVATAR